MVHDPQLPEDWAERVGRAYLTFGVESLLEKQDTELGLRSFFRGAQDYWTTDKRRRKAKGQRRNEEGEWAEERGVDLPDVKARASTAPREEVDEIDLPDEPAKKRFRLPQINPGLSKRSEAIKGEHGGPAKNVRGEAFRRDRIESVIPKHVLDELNAKRAEEGLEPFMVPDGPWEGNGADLRNLSDDVVKEMLERLRVGKLTDPQAAGSIEEMTANIVDAFKAASGHEADYGEEWYARAAEAVLKLAEDYEVDPHVVAALVASTSPRTEWEGNLVAARVALESLMPEKSPHVTKKFLDTRMTYDTGLDGKPLALDENGNRLKPPTGKDYILAREGVRASFKKKHPQHAVQSDKVDPKTGKRKWIPTESDEDYEKRIDDAIMEVLNTKNPDGTPMQIYQIRDQKLRAALMDINNRVLAENQVLPEGFERRPGMGYQYPKISSDGHVQQDRLRGFAKILSGNHSAIDRLFGYDDLDPLQHHLPKGWSGIPEDKVDLYHRINETLGGHKTRSFYNNIITGGQSDFATIDVHALRAALLGKAATRSGVAVPKAEELLENPKFEQLPKLPASATPAERAERAAENARRKTLQKQWKDEKRNGVYAVVNEAFRQATEQINAERAKEGKPPLSPAQVQAVAWVASRPESVGADFSNMAMQERDPDKVAARVLPGVKPEHRDRALELVGAARTLPAARRNLKIAGIDPDKFLPNNEVGEARFKAASAAAKPMLDEFNKFRKQPGTMNLNVGQLATAAWLTNKFDDNEVAERMRETFKDKRGVKPKFTAADARVVREMMFDRHTKDELIAGGGKKGIQSRLDAYNAERRKNGIYADPLTYDQFLKFLKTGDYE
jgi:hypothetical protein